MSDQTVSSFTTSINYEKTLEIRLSLSIKMMQQFSVLAGIDSDASSKLTLWQNYYKQLVAFQSSQQYEDSYNLAIPDA